MQETIWLPCNGPVPRRRGSRVKGYDLGLGDRVCVQGIGVQGLKLFCLGLGIGIKR